MNFLLSAVMTALTIYVGIASRLDLFGVQVLIPIIAFLLF